MGIWIGDEIECDIRPKKKRDVISFQNNKILKKRKKLIVKIKFRFSDHEYSKKNCNQVAVHVSTILTIKFKDTFCGIRILSMKSTVKFDC